MDEQEEKWERAFQSRRSPQRTSRGRLGTSLGGGGGAPPSLTPVTLNDNTTPVTLADGSTPVTLSV